MPLWINEVSVIISLGLSLGNLIIMFYALSNFLRRPNKTQDERLDEHDRKFEEVEKEIDKINERLSNGTIHFHSIDESNAITAKALMSIMDSLMTLLPTEEAKHELKASRKALYEYLTDK